MSAKDRGQSFLHCFDIQPWTESGDGNFAYLHDRGKHEQTKEKKEQNNQKHDSPLDRGMTRIPQCCLPPAHHSPHPLMAELRFSLHVACDKTLCFGRSFAGILARKPTGRFYGHFAILEYGADSEKLFSHIEN